MTEGTFAAGVDLCGASLKLALLDGNGRIVARETVPTEAASGPGAVLGRLAKGVRRLAAVVPEDAVARLALGVPVRVAMDEGVVYDAHNLPGAGRASGWGQAGGDGLADAGDQRRAGLCGRGA